MTSRPGLIAAVLDEAATAARRAALAEVDGRQARREAPCDALAFLVRVAGSLPRAAALAGIGETTARDVAAGRTCNAKTARLIVDAACRVAAGRAHRLCGPGIPKPRVGDEDEPARMSRREVVVIETEHLLGSGESPWQIARRLGLQLDSLRTALVRAERPDLAERVLPGQARTG